MDIYFSKQFVFFVLSGAIAAFLHWTSRIALGKWLQFTWSVAIAYIIGMSVAFLLNKFLVFPNSTRKTTKQARDFILINLVFFPIVYISSIYLNITIQHYLPEKYSQAIAHAIAVSIPTFLTFLMYKIFSFKEQSNEQKKNF